MRRRVARTATSAAAAAFTLSGCAVLPVIAGQGGPIEDAPTHLHTLAEREGWVGTDVLLAEFERADSYAFAVYRDLDMPDHECWFSWQVEGAGASGGGGGGGGGCVEPGLGGEVAQWAWSPGAPSRMEAVVAEGVEQVLITFADGSTQIAWSQPADGFRLRFLVQQLDQPVSEVVSVQAMAH